VDNAVGPQILSDELGRELLVLREMGKYHLKIKNLPFSK
jgi:hypothetical protein